jgi:hypothetical protein
MKTIKNKNRILYNFFYKKGKSILGYTNLKSVKTTITDAIIFSVKRKLKLLNIDFNFDFNELKQKPDKDYISDGSIYNLICIDYNSTSVTYSNTNCKKRKFELEITQGGIVYI